MIITQADLPRAPPCLQACVASSWSCHRPPGWASRSRCAAAPSRPTARWSPSSGPAPPPPPPLPPPPSPLPPASASTATRATPAPGRTPGAAERTAGWPTARTPSVCPPRRRTTPARTAAGSPTPPASRSTPPQSCGSTVRNATNFLNIFLTHFMKICFCV